jgi:hypothetical protein
MLVILNCTLLYFQNDFSTKVNISAEFHKMQHQLVALYFVHVCRCYLMVFAYLVEPDVLEVVKSPCLLGICRFKLVYFPKNTIRHSHNSTPLVHFVNVIDLFGKCIKLNVCRVQQDAVAILYNILLPLFLTSLNPHLTCLPGPGRRTTKIIAMHGTFGYLNC